MHAADITEDFPVITIDAEAVEAVRMIAEQLLPGILVVDASGGPFAVLPASEVVRFIVPRFVQEGPLLAGVLSESVADHLAERLAGKTVGAMLPEHLVDVPPAQFDDTILEVAAKMARLRTPLIPVVKHRTLLGVITAARLLAAAMKS